MIPEVRVGATDNGVDIVRIVGLAVGLALGLAVGAIVIGASFGTLVVIPAFHTMYPGPSTSRSQQAVCPLVGLTSISLDALN